MSRSNRLINRIFNEIIGGNGKSNTIEDFLKTDSEFNINESAELKYHKEIYDNIYKDIKLALEELAHLEEIIIQLRCIEMIPQEMKFSLVREYIYARTTFFRSDKEINDIRIIVGKIDDFDEPYETLIQNPNFINDAQLKLKNTMMDEVTQNFYNENLADS